MLAILTKYYGATNTRGARIVAVGPHTTHRASIPFPHEADGMEAHRMAAQALANKFGWTINPEGGGTRDGYAFLVSGHTPRKNPAAKRRATRIGRVSQATGKAPTKRLRARRAANRVPGTFPNPISGANEWREECNYISRVMDKGGRVKEMNNDPAVFRRYCEMQRNSAEKAGFHDAALYIQEIIDDLKPTKRNPAAKRTLVYTVQYEPPESREHGADSPLSYVGWKTVATFADKSKAFEYAKAFAKAHKLRARVIN